MGYIEIILEDIEISRLEEVFGKIMFSKDDIISSHFFVKGEDVEYQNIENLKGYFQSSGTCNLYIKKIAIGMILRNALIVIAGNGISADITISVSRECFGTNDKQGNELSLLLKLLVQVSEEGAAKKIILGYEPACDEDMKILEISEGKTTVFPSNFGDDSLCQNIADSLQDGKV